MLYSAENNYHRSATRIQLCSLEAYHDAEAQAQGSSQKHIAILYVKVLLAGYAAHQYIDANDAGSKHARCKESVRLRRRLLAN
jgi:hypothetical protein